MKKSNTISTKKNRAVPDSEVAIKSLINTVIWINTFSVTSVVLVEGRNLRYLKKWTDKTKMSRMVKSHWSKLNTFFSDLGELTL